MKSIGSETVVWPLAFVKFVWSMAGRFKKSECSFARIQNGILAMITVVEHYNGDSVLRLVVVVGL